MGLREIVARNLRRLRRSRGLSQEELADRAGINRNYVGMLEREENSATVDMLEKLADVLSGYDQEHLVTYLRLLDADAEGADWTEAARIVLHIDPPQEPERARRAWESHLKRAKWMTEHGYRHLLKGGAPH